MGLVTARYARPLQAILRLRRVRETLPVTTSTVVKTLGLVLSLGFDTFAVAIGLGMSGLSRRDQYRFGASFAVAEGCMPLVGFAFSLTLVGTALGAAIGERVAKRAALLSGRVLTVLALFLLAEKLHGA